MEIILASNNQGKIKEIRQLVAPYSINILPQSELCIEEVEETGLSFIENALIKARHASSVSGLPALADDSGLVVPALGGEPGIYSARYAGNAGGAVQNIEKLLIKLKDITGTGRNAFFYTVIVLLNHASDPCPIVCEGRWNGQILHKPTGSHGFGYDPIFYDFINQCSAAELTSDLKNKVSHRGQAMRQLLSKMELLSSCRGA